MNKTSLAVAAVAVTGVSLALSALGQTGDNKLGTVHFETSCKPEAQKLFDRGMLYQHSFWYRASQKTFEDVLKADPECAIAYWGIALSLLNNPHAPPPVGNLPLGLAAIEKAKAVGAKTQRERDFINAMSAFYTDFDKVDHRTRVLAYLKAMEGVAQAYPNDDEAQILYAIELNVAAPPSDKTYAMQLKGAAILEPIFQRQPRHPGVAHYLIHLYDTPALAEKGLDAAKRYSQIAPAAPHAQHMPSHIFTRVGYWKESIGSNADAARSAKASNEAHDELHAMDYLVYAYLQLGRYDDAHHILDQLKEMQGLGMSDFKVGYAATAMPVRYAVERHQWGETAGIKPDPSSPPHVAAIAVWAHALGLVRGRHPADASAELAALAGYEDQLHRLGNEYWAAQTSVLRQEILAWSSQVNSKPAEAESQMRTAADQEDAMEKLPVTPGPIVPAREQLGELLLQQHRPAEAAEAFKASLVNSPNRKSGTDGLRVAQQK